MDELTAALKRADAKVLGSRIKAARLRRGMTQPDLARDDFTVSYLSRIESGKRRPEKGLLELIATRLDCEVGELLAGAMNAAEQTDRLSVDYAELALETGEPLEALRQAESVLSRPTMEDSPLRVRAELIRCRALETTGELRAAVASLEEILGRKTLGTVPRASVALALCRCYREVGELSEAVRTGSTVLDELREAGLEITDEYVELTVTVASAHFALGDIDRAVRMCRMAAESADGIGSPHARAAAYWNSSIMESERGHIDSAVPLANRALALLSQGSDVRSIARLRCQLGNLLLKLNPPQVEEAIAYFERADSEMRSSSASVIDLVRNQVGLARASLLAGDMDRATMLVEAAIGCDIDVPTLLADALLLRGRIQLEMGEPAAASRDFLEAVRTLSAIGSDRAVAQIWMDLAAHLERVGASQAALDAYRRAAVSTGLAFAVESAAAEVTAPTAGS